MYLEQADNQHASPPSDEDIVLSLHTPQRHQIVSDVYVDPTKSVGMAPLPTAFQVGTCQTVVADHCEENVATSLPTDCSVSIAAR